MKHHRQLKIATYPSFPETDQQITMSFIEQSLAAHAKKAGSNGEAGLCCPICIYDTSLGSRLRRRTHSKRVFEEEEKKIIRPIWKKEEIMMNP